MEDRGDLTLRPARPDDSEFAYAVRRAAFREYVERGARWDEDEQRTLHDRRFRSQDFRVLRVADIDVGVLAMVVASDAVRVNQLFLLPEHQGKGIGHRCMLVVMEEARARGLPVRLRVMKVNPRARAFYERLGFARRGETETHTLMEWTPDWTDLERLVVVPGHAVYVADDFTAVTHDRSWWLQPFQTGEPPLYIDHIRCGVETAAAEPTSLLVFSGGQTRREAGPRSEARGYWSIANHFDWWERSHVRARSTTEEHARDSYENLLFSICRFRECTGRYPASVTIIGWAFKERRFDLHRATIGWTSPYLYVGVNDPVDLDGALKGENDALGAFDEDPFGTNHFLSEKRRERDPFRREPPYAESCPEVADLLRHETSAGKPFKGTLPWRASR